MLTLGPPMLAPLAEADAAIVAMDGAMLIVGEAAFDQASARPASRRCTGA